jgi:hypothetical protein
VSTGRRLTALLVTLAVLGAPAVVLRVFCVGNACDQAGARAVTAVPFCGLPERARSLVEAGYREGRTPEVMAVTRAGRSVVAPGSGAWPRLGGSTAVPIVIAGPGVEPGRLPGGTGLDQVAPTLEPLAGIDRGFPRVRSGVAVPGVVATDAPVAPLVVLIGWGGADGRTLGLPAAGGLRVMAEAGAATARGTTGSLPLDPAATLTTLGTGGLPADHGIVGGLLRGDDGELARAWGAGSPPAVIASFADDLDRAYGERSLVGAILARVTQRGIVGDGWYLDADRDRVSVGSDPVAEVDRALAAGFGRDGVPDLLGIALDPPVRSQDAVTTDIVSAVRAAVPGAVIAIAGTGALPSVRSPIAVTPAARLAADVDASLGAPVVEASGAAGLFVDQAVAERQQLSADTVAQRLGSATDTDGNPVIADAFPAFAVAFGRYC